MNNNVSREIYCIINEAKNISVIYPDRSYAMCIEAYNISRKHKLKIEEGYALICMSHACRAKSDINKMLNCSYDALEIFEEEQDISGKIKSLNLIGIAYFYSSMYEEALKYLLRVMDLLNEFKDYFLLSSVLNNIGEVLRESAKYDKALKYYNSALEVCTNNDLNMNKASIFSNIGEVYFLEKKYEDALEYYTKSYDILINEKDMINLGEVENKLGKVHYINGNYNKAEKYFLSALNRLEKVNNKFYAIDALVNIGQLKIENNSDSFHYFEKAIQYAEETSAKKKLSEVCKTVAEYYEKTGNLRDALEYYKKYCRVNEEIMTSNLGDKLEILKIELDHLQEKDKFEKFKMLNQRLEMEIFFQKNELVKIRKSNEVLEKKTLEDELTGIPNRRYLKQCLDKTWEESLLYDDTIVLFFIDIDNFKKYNDYWGHSKGDECLINVANCMKNIQVKRNDVIGRYGGEEFIYYAEGLNYDQALELGNLIRNEVKKIAMYYIADDKKEIVTISVGGALGKAADLKSISNMLKIADKQLYKAKNMGRNITLLRDIMDKQIPKKGLSC